MPARSVSAESDAKRGSGGGSFTIIEQVRIDYDDGSAVIGPAGEAMASAREVGISAGDIIDIACKIFPSLCGGGGGGGGGKPGCYVIIGPDGTEITICPPKKA